MQARALAEARKTISGLRAGATFCRRTKGFAGTVTLFWQRLFRLPRLPALRSGVEPWGSRASPTPRRGRSRDVPTSGRRRCRRNEVLDGVVASIARRVHASFRFRFPARRRAHAASRGLRDGARGVSWSQTSRRCCPRSARTHSLKLVRSSGVKLLQMRDVGPFARVCPASAVGKPRFLLRPRACELADVSLRMPRHGAAS